jgi:hypothetical protein
LSPDPNFFPAGLGGCALSANCIDCVLIIVLTGFPFPNTKGNMRRRSKIPHYRSFQSHTVGAL